MKTWVVLPAYNEEEALPKVLTAIDDAFKEAKRNFSIIVVNDGSQDATGMVAQAYATKVPVEVIHNEQNVGLAETLRRGLLAAVNRSGDRDVIVTMDADNSHPAGLALRMTRLIQEGNDVVIASRYRVGSRVLGLALYRRFLSFVASWLFRVLFPTPGVRDFTCGYRAYRATHLKKLVAERGKEFISENGFSCMVDILLRLRTRHTIFTEVPMVLRYDLKPGRSKMNVAQTIADTLRLLFRRRFVEIKG